ncbi:hypothetical protein [Coleofasciculus sp. C1-SOL-03]|uniref:hypothetical protein n=1 Tax=Coleofasciculus sp. C1-SOL-03 TaxID=3069522 RepID=UPI0040628A00
MRLRHLVVGIRAGFVVLFTVCIIIVFLNPPLHDWENGDAIAWNIRRDFFIGWWGEGGCKLFGLRCV